MSDICRVPFVRFGAYVGLGNPPMLPQPLWGEVTSGATRIHVSKDRVSHLLDPPIEAGKLKGEGIV